MKLWKRGTTGRAVSIAGLVLGVLALCGCGASGAVEPSPHASPSALGDPAERALDDLWDRLMSKYPDAVRPSVALIRYVSNREMAGAQAECMNGQGFLDVVATPDGGLSTGRVPPEQDEAFQLATFTCRSQYQIDPKYSEPLTAEQLGMLYDYYVSNLVPCLEGEGFVVSRQPSRAVFIDSYANEGWTPYVDVVGLSQDEWYRVNEVCPQWPSGFYGY